MSEWADGCRIWLDLAQKSRTDCIYRAFSKVNVVLPQHHPLNLFKTKMTNNKKNEFVKWKDVSNPHVIVDIQHV
ncbi:hypothetical protein A2U01_0023311, partial [Trifolium medium]|nr:hypothetical protein [Trifolium medium]